MNFCQKSGNLFSCLRNSVNCEFFSSDPISGCLFFAHGFCVSKSAQKEFLKIQKDKNMDIQRQKKITSLIQALKNSATGGLNAVLSPEDCKLLLIVLVKKKRPIDQLIDGLTGAAKEVIESFGDDLKNLK